MNAAKLEKIHAKPFIAALPHHTDGVQVMAKNRFNLVDMISGSADGEIIYWSIPARKPLFRINAHENFVKGLAFANNGRLAADSIFTSVGMDKKVHLWSVSKLKDEYQQFYKAFTDGHQVEGNEGLVVNTTVSPDGPANTVRNYNPRATYVSKHTLTYCDHSYGEDLFATSGSVVQVWNYERSLPLQTFEWGVDTVTKLKFNPSQQNLLAAVCMDRSICFYDIRGNTPINKIYMRNKSSALCWNPQEPMNLVVGNENSHCYTFDLRKPDQAKMMHKDHINAVLDIDFAPTGREFVTASFDKTIRIFPMDSGRSREVYHTKRMQQVNSIIYSMDNRLILSGSEDTNVRIWKANAADSMKTLLPREKEALAYAAKLKNRHKYDPTVKRILRHEHLPALIKKRKEI